MLAVPEMASKSVHWLDDSWSASRAHGAAFVLHRVAAPPTRSFMEWPLARMVGSTVAPTRPSPRSVCLIAAESGGGTADRLARRSFAVSCVSLDSQDGGCPHDVRCEVACPFVRARFSAELQGSRRPKERAPCEAAKRSPPRPSDVRHASSSCQPGCRTDVVTYFASHASMLYGPSLGCLNGSSTVSQGAPVWTARYGPSKCGTHVEEPRSRRQIALVVRTWQRASVPSAASRRLMTKAD